MSFSWLKYVYRSLKLNFIRRWNYPVRPKFINFLLTYSCNSRCLMCQVWDIYRKNPALSSQELTLAEIERFIAENLSYLADLRNVGLSGGDPLLMRGDFVEIVRLIKTMLPRVHLGVQTNGLKPEIAQRRLREVLDFYPDFSIAVSFDGIGSTHSRIRGVENAFRDATETVEIARRLGIRNITSGMTVTSYNYREIAEVKKYVESLGIEFSCFPAEVSDYFNNQGDNTFQLNRDQCADVIKALSENCGYHYYMDNLRLQLQSKRRRQLPCFSGFTSLVIDPYGNVKPCVLKVKGIDNDSFGNIKKSTLEEMLGSRRAKEIRKKISQCSCWCQCEVSSSVVIFPFDLLWWFIFYCPDKKGFLSHVLSKKEKLSSLL